MTRMFVASVTLLALSNGTTAVEELRSGLQPGDLATPFEVRDVTGPNRGISLCYR